MFSKPKPQEFIHASEMISNFVYFNLEPKLWKRRGGKHSKVFWGQTQ
jgi:hypothetical protein